MKGNKPVPCPPWMVADALARYKRIITQTDADTWKVAIDTFYARSPHDPCTPYLFEARRAQAMRKMNMCITNAACHHWSIAKGRPAFEVINDIAALGNIDAQDVWFWRYFDR